MEIARQAIEKAKEEHHDYVILDTAGRLHIDHELMDELSGVKEVANPEEIFLVVDSMTGQDAVNVAKSFNDQLGLTGVILTKLDGDTRGGAALSSARSPKRRLNSPEWEKSSMLLKRSILNGWHPGFSEWVTC